MSDKDGGGATGVRDDHHYDSRNHGSISRTSQSRRSYPSFSSRSELFFPRSNPTLTSNLNRSESNLGSSGPRTHDAHIDIIPRSDLDPNPSRSTRSNSNIRGGATNTTRSRAPGRLDDRHYPSSSTLLSFGHSDLEKATAKAHHVPEPSSIEPSPPLPLPAGRHAPDRSNRPPSADDDDNEKEEPSPSDPYPPATVASGPLQPDPPPDGGLAAWLTVVGAFFALFASFGWINAVGVFQEHYQTHQLSNYSPSAIAWISSMEVYALFVGGPFVGFLFDRFGPRYLLAVGSFLHVFGLVMTSLSSKYYQFLLAQGICSSIGSSLLFYPSMTSTSTWFARRRGIALGIVTAGASIGGVVFPIMIRRLLPLIGFGWSMRAAALVVLVSVAVGNLLIKSRLRPNRRKWSIAHHLQPLSEPVFRLLGFGCLLFFLGMFIPMTFSIMYARHIGMSESLAAYVLPILNASSLFGRIFPPWLSDKVGRFNVTVATCILTGLFDLAVWMPARTNGSDIAFVTLYGFTSGTFVSMIPALVAQITTNPTMIGVRTGTLFFILSIGVLIGNPVGGALLSHWNGQYTGLQIFCGVCQLGGGFSILAARIKSGGWSPRTVV